MRFFYIVMILVFFSCQEKKIAKEPHPNEMSTLTKGARTFL